MSIIESTYCKPIVRDLPTLELGSEYESTPLLGECSKQVTKMVGRSNELRRIMDQLTGHTYGQKKVISILGMGGIGKTSLARRVYEDPLVESHFDVRAWTTASQQPNLREMVSGLLLSLPPTLEGIDIKGSTDEVAHQLQKSLRGRRYLIVVDDVWKTSVWDYLFRCLPESCGSRVLLTTRLNEIALYSASSGTNLHNLNFLDSNESWDLFCNSFSCEQTLPFKFHRIGRNIVERCQGLPLAIVVVAGLLSKLNKTLDDWENVEKEIASLVSTDLSDQCSKILALSYNQLPMHLKACFLYLGVFYANSEIPVKKLVRLWIAEGFVKLVRDKSLEDVGGGYLQDLISRSLVLIDKVKPDGQIKICRMHDLVHGLCVRQATKENLLYSEDSVYDPIADFRWLSFRSSKPEHHDMCNNLKKARSILCLHEDDEMPMVIDPKPAKFSILRVLDLSSPLYTKGIRVSFTDQTDLVPLRYLAFTFDRSLGSQGLENLLFKNQKLQTLVVSHSEGPWPGLSIDLPSVIRGSPQLRHLKFSKWFRVKTPSMVKENLQSLYWLSISHCTEEVFSRIPNVNTLGIFSRGLNPEDGISCNNPNSLESLGHLNQLEVLTIESDTKQQLSAMEGYNNNCLVASSRGAQTENGCFLWAGVGTN